MIYRIALYRSKTDWLIVKAADVDEARKLFYRWLAGDELPADLEEPMTDSPILSYEEAYADGDLRRDLDLAVIETASVVDSNWEDEVHQKPVPHVTLYPAPDQDTPPRHFYQQMIVNLVTGYINELMKDLHTLRYELAAAPETLSRESAHEMYGRAGLVRTAVDHLMREMDAQRQREEP